MFGNSAQTGASTITKLLVMEMAVSIYIYLEALTILKVHTLNNTILMRGSQYFLVHGYVGIESAHN